MCDCVWQELPNQTGTVKGSVLVTECDPCKAAREAAASADAEAYAFEHSVYKLFDYTLFEGRIIQVMPQPRWFQLSLLGIHYTMQRLIEYPGRSIDNFTRFKGYIDGLLAQAVLTADEVKTIVDLFAEQNVDLYFGNPPEPEPPVEP